MKKKTRNRILASIMSMVMVLQLIALGTQQTVHAETLTPEIGVAVTQTLAEDASSVKVDVQATLPVGYVIQDMQLGDWAKEDQSFIVKENGTYTLTVHYGPAEEEVLPSEEPTVEPTEEATEVPAAIEATEEPAPTEAVVEEVPASEVPSVIPEVTEEAVEEEVAPLSEESIAPEEEPEVVPTEEATEETGFVFFYDTFAEEETPVESISYTYTEEIVVEGIVAPEAAPAEAAPALSPVVLRAPRAISAPVTIIVQDQATNAYIAGAHFNFYSVNLSTGVKTPIAGNPYTTNASGEASIGVQAAGKYVAVYANDGSIDASVFDVSGLVGHEFEITVSVDDTPGVQLTEEWAWDLGGTNFKWRDMIIDGDAVLVCGQVQSTITVPGAYTLDGNPVTIDPVNGTGIVMKIDQATKKMIYYTQYPSDAASYSMVKSGNLYAVTAYKNNILLINSNDGTIANTIDASTYFGGSNTEALFDITATSDGGYALVGWNLKLCKIDATGNLVYTTTTNVMPDAIKSVMEVAPDTYVISGGGNGPYAYLTKIQVAADGTPTTIFTSRVGDGTGNSRFNDVLAVEEDGHQYYLASGNYGCTTAGCTIPGSETVDGNPITLVPSTVGVSRTACLFKYDENGKIVFAIALGGNNIASSAFGGEQEFNNVKLAYDSLGGYIVSGQIIGTANLTAAETTIGQATAVNSGSNTDSGSIIVRYTKDGKYVDSYTDGSITGKPDQFYGGVVTENAYFTSGDDGSKSIVKLSSALTSSPRVVKLPKVVKYKIVTGVASSDGTISGLGWSYYEEVQSGGTNTRAITATANSGYLVTKVEIINSDTNAVEQTYIPNAASYTVAAGSITVNSNKFVRATFGTDPAPTPIPTVTPGPTATPNPSRTCQDDGYPAGYYWNGTACVINTGFEAPRTYGSPSGFQAPLTGIEDHTIAYWIGLGLGLMGLAVAIYGTKKHSETH